ncbi:MAG: hypothetical protein ACLSFZ_08240 [Frisingicoccus sp.]
MAWKYNPLYQPERQLFTRISMNFADSGRIGQRPVSEAEPETAQEEIMEPETEQEMTPEDDLSDLKSILESIPAAESVNTLNLIQRKSLRLLRKRQQRKRQRKKRRKNRRKNWRKKFRKCRRKNRRRRMTMI